MTCPQVNSSAACARRFLDLFGWLGLSGFDESLGHITHVLRPKLNCFILGQHPWERLYDIHPDDLPYLIKQIDASRRDPFGIIETRRGYFVQCYAKGRRFTVEWAQNHYTRTRTDWDQWRAQDRQRLAALDVPYQRNLPPKIDPDLLRFADTLCIFEAFLREEARPAGYHWMNINDWIPK